MFGSPSMAEEFQESDVIFSDELCYPETFGESNGGDNQKTSKRKKKRSDNTTRFSSSLPVNIPENVFRRYMAKNSPEELSDEEYSDGEGEIVPPHVIVGRRIQGQMAFSVCTGNGRTLKGRDLSRVRNSVLRMTGFLEA